jgi:hypothetical protein
MRWKRKQDSCVDQLSRIIICWLGREQPTSTCYAPPHVPRLIVPWISFNGSIDSAFDQIRHYAVTDLAVSLRLIRALQDIASATKAQDEQQLLVALARRILAGSQKHRPESELRRSKQRVVDLEAQVAAVTPKTRQRSRQQSRSPYAFAGSRGGPASKIPLVAEDQRLLREFAGVVLALEHFVVVRSEQHFGPRPAQFCAHDPAVKQFERYANAPEEARNRKRVLAGEAARIVIVQVKEGHGRSSKRPAQTPFSLEDAREGIGIRDGAPRRRIRTA